MIVRELCSALWNPRLSASLLFISMPQCRFLSLQPSSGVRWNDKTLKTLAHYHIFWLMKQINSLWPGGIIWWHGSLPEPMLTNHQHCLVVFTWRQFHRKGEKYILHIFWLMKQINRWCLMVTQIWVNIGSGNGLVPDGTKPLPEPMLTNHQHCLVAFTWRQFHRKGEKYILLIWILNKITEWVVSGDWRPNWVIVISRNGSVPICCQANPWINTDLLSLEPLGRHFWHLH